MKREIVSRVACGHTPFTCQEMCGKAFDGSSTVSSGDDTRTTTDSACFGERDHQNILYKPCDGEDMTISSVEDAYTLLDMQRVLFTTEGHTFLLWPSLKSRSKDGTKMSKKHSKRGKKINKKRRGGAQGYRRHLSSSSSSKCPNDKLQQEGDRDRVNSGANAQSTSDQLAKGKKNAKMKKKKKNSPNIVDADIISHDRANEEQELETMSKSSSDLDSLSRAIGAYIATNGDHKFSIECSYKGTCKLVRAEDTISQRGSQTDWNIIDVDMYIAKIPNLIVEDAAATTTDDLDDHNDVEQAEEGMVEEKEENEDGKNKVGENKEDVETFQRLTQLDAIEIPLSESSESILPVTSMTASPALFGPKLPSSAETETKETPLSVQLNMIEPFYFGCADPTTLDPSLKGSATLDPSIKHSMGFGMIVYRGLCSFTQKARLAQWLGSSLVVVVDSDTQGFVADPPQRSKTELQEEKNSLNLFFQQLRSGQLPTELGKTPPPTSSPTHEAMLLIFCFDYYFLFICKIILFQKIFQRVRSRKHFQWQMMVQVCT